MKRLTVPVRCSVCHKKLRGQPNAMMGGFRLSFHRGANSKPCPGMLTYAHRPVPKKPT